MARVREHINGLDLTNVIAAFTKDGGVTGKRGRSAGNVDDAFGTHGKDGVKNGPLTAGSWRIKDNDVGRIPSLTRRGSSLAASAQMNSLFLM